MNGQPERPSEVLARQLRYWRDRRKLSAEALAKRLADLGAPTLNRRVISKIENRDRGVTLDEALQLAHALAVPPPLLFIDLAGGSPVRIADEAVLHPWLAWEWVTGDEPPLISTLGPGRTVITRADEFGDARQVVYLYRFKKKADRAVQNAESDIRRAQVAGNAQREQAARDRYAEALAELVRCYNDMIENGVKPPAVVQERADDMRALGTLKYPERLEIFEPAEVDDASR